MALAGPLYQAVTASGWGKVVYEIYFQFGDQRVRPDLALLSRSTLDSADPDRVPMRAIPEIVVEIVSPSDIVYRLDRKIAVYLEAGVKEVWVLYPDLRHVLIHTGSAIRDLRGSDELTAPVLPGWSLPVERLFA
jgi:Uma2 family endonuclease